jgi:hypothetical protein
MARWDIRKIPRNLYKAFVYGVSANITEALFYEEVEVHEKGIETILIPVFSVGFFNFQLYQGENIPSQQEVYDFINTYPQEIATLQSKCNNHDLENHNWRKTPNGLKLIDFAGQPLDSHLFVFLKSIIRHDTWSQRYQS